MLVHFAFASKEERKKAIENASVLLDGCNFVRIYPSGNGFGLTLGNGSKGQSQVKLANKAKR